MDTYSYHVFLANIVVGNISRDDLRCKEQVRILGWRGELEQINYLFILSCEGAETKDLEPGQQIKPNCVPVLPNSNIIL